MDISISGNNNMVNLAIYKDNYTSYSLSLTQGLSIDEVSNIIESLS